MSSSALSAAHHAIAPASTDACLAPTRNPKLLGPVPLEQQNCPLARAGTSNTDVGLPVWRKPWPLAHCLSLLAASPARQQVPWREFPNRGSSLSQCHGHATSRSLESRMQERKKKKDKKKDRRRKLLFQKLKVGHFINQYATPQPQQNQQTLLTSLGNTKAVTYTNWQLTLQW